MFAIRAGSLTTESGRRKHLTRVAKVPRIKGAAHELHGVEVGRSKHVGHVLFLVKADAVLPRYRPALVQTHTEDVTGELLRALRLSVHVAVVQHEGVKISVTGMKYVGD